MNNLYIKVLEEKVQQTVLKESEKLKKFPMSLLERNLDYYYDLLELGVWATQSFEPIYRCLNSKQKYIVFVGFKYSVFHLGHLTLAKELAWHYSNGGIPFFVVSGHEGNDISLASAKKYVSEFLGIARSFTNVDIISNHIYLDINELGIFQLETMISRTLNINKIKQIYGWKENESLYKLRIPSFLCASFLFPQFLHNSTPVVVLADINQATHMEILKVITKKLQLSTPAISYRHLLPSIKKVNERMSIKDRNAAIFISDDELIMEKKMSQCITGGRSTKNEQFEKGGNPNQCSFFWIANTVLDKKEIIELLSMCTSGKSLCSECKLQYKRKIINKIRSCYNDK